MKIYLSGPITGVANYRENFRRAKEALTRDGYTQIINPAELCEVLPESIASWEDYLEICLDLLDKAEAVVLLPGWDMSRGVRREIRYAIAKDKLIMEYETTMERYDGGRYDRHGVRLFDGPAGYGGRDQSETEGESGATVRSDPGCYPVRRPPCSVVTV